MKPFRFLFLGTILVLVSGCGSSHSISQDNYLVDRGRIEISKGNYRQAEANLLVALDINPANPHTMLYLGEVYQHTDRIEKARQMYQRVIDLDANVKKASTNGNETGQQWVTERARESLISLGEKNDVAPIHVDSDGDGVKDNEDQCHGTPMGAVVDRFGCWVLSGVLFNRGKWEINHLAYESLDHVVTVLKKNPSLNIEIQGHTDNLGPAAFNQWLSEMRAKVIREYLIKKGISGNRLKRTGYGFRKPIASNDTAEGRARNRRVELKPVGK